MLKNNKIWTLALIYLVFSSFIIFALPAGPSIDYITNSTAPLRPATQLVTEGGSFTTIILNATSQNYRWKAYIGNVTGYLTLQDSGNYSIYDWALANPQGEVYASRSDNIAWSNIECAQTSTIETEDSYLSFLTTQVDSINNTFSQKIHKGFRVGGQDITESSCFAITTNIGGTVQTQDVNAKFQEILLEDGNNLIFSTIIEPATQGFDNNIYDFQMIVPNDETSETPTPYYFYVELG